MEKVGDGVQVKRRTRSSSTFVQRLLRNRNRFELTPVTRITSTSDGVVLERAETGLKTLRERILRFSKG